MNRGKMRRACLRQTCNDALGGGKSHLLQNLNTIASFRSFRNGQIACEQWLSESYYFLCSGAAKEFVIYPDGHDQIVDILLPGDYSNVVLQNSHGHSLQALSDHTLMICYPRRRVDALAASDPVVAAQLHQMALTILVRWKDHLLTLGQLTAIGKVSSFILEMKARLPVNDSGAFDLPVSRYDIASYLGISVETVSRSLSSLRERGAIQLLGNRRLCITSLDALGADIESEELTPPESDRADANGSHCQHVHPRDDRRTLAH